MTRVRCGDKRGFTLIELMIAIGVMATMLVAVGGLVHACLRAESTREESSTIYEEGALAMERMVSGVKACTYLQIPNSHTASRDTLVFSGSAQADGDSYFGDSLFPRVDEDVSSDMSGDSFPGVRLYDDDGDGLVDEAGGLPWSDAVKDDDEDGAFDEDWLDGVDNDKDGNIDEDLPSDESADLMPGVETFDDDADGTIDEGGAGSAGDDDEDGSVDEDAADPIAYAWDSGTKTLWEMDPAGGSAGIICENVTAFTATYHPPDCAADPYLTISLTLTSADGWSVTFTEDVYPRNIVQRRGRRVR